MEYPVKAACQCGQATYELKAAPLKVMACHCKECQKLATAPFSVTAVVASTDISFSGELKEWSRSSDSGNTNTAMFCPNCGNRIYHVNPEQPDLIKLKLKPVDPDCAHLFEPTAHVWVREKQSWYVIPDGVDVFETQP